MQIVAVLARLDQPRQRFCRFAPPTALYVRSKVEPSTYIVECCHCPVVPRC